MPKTLLTSLLIAGGFIAVCYAAIGLPRFETIDDIWMAAIAAGVGVVDRPDEHILWTNFLIGLGLKSLNTVSPGLPWYGIYMLVLDFIGVSTLLFLLLIRFKENSSSTKILVVSILFVTVFLRAVLVMQYTTTSALFSIAASLLMLASLEENEKFKSDSRFKSKCWILSVALLVIAGLVRERAVYMVSVLAAITVVSRYLVVAQWRKMFYGFVWVAMALAISFGISGSNDWYYSRNEWREFYPLNRLYIPLMQYNRFIYNNADVRAYASVGMTPVDLEILRKWYVLDRKKFTMDNFRQIRKNMDLLPRLEPYKLTDAFLDALNESYAYPLLATIFCLIAFNFRQPDFKCNAVLMIGSFGLVGWLLLFMKLPSYILNVILMYVLFVMLWFTPGKAIDELTRFIDNRKKILAVAICCALLVSPMVLSYRDMNATFDAGKKVFKVALRMLHPSPDDLYVEWGGSLPLLAIRPFDDITAYFKNFKIVRIASFGRSPHIEERLRQWGITDLICQLDKDHVYSITIKSDYFEEPINDYVAQSCRKKLTFTDLYNFKALNFRVRKAEYSPLP